MAKATYDPEAQAFYAYLKTKPVELTMSFANDKLLIDFDSEGTIVGVEILGVEGVLDISQKPAVAPQVSELQLQLV